MSSIISSSNVISNEYLIHVMLYVQFSKWNVANETNRKSTLYMSVYVFQQESECISTSLRVTVLFLIFQDQLIEYFKRTLYVNYYRSIIDETSVKIRLLNKIYKIKLWGDEDSVIEKKGCYTFYFNRRFENFTEFRIGKS